MDICISIYLVIPELTRYPPASHIIWLTILDEDIGTSSICSPVLSHTPFLLNFILSQGNTKQWPP